MTRKRKPSGLLGPDGRPIAESRYRKPEPSPSVSISDEVHMFTITTAENEDGVVSSYYAQAIERWMQPQPNALLTFRGRAVSDGSKPKKKRTLADRVNDDLRAVGVDPHATGEAELPRPEPDLTAYGDAFEAAVRSCPHDDVESTMYAKGEYQCVACGRYLDAEAMRARSRRSGFGRMFGR